MRLIASMNLTVDRPIAEVFDYVSDMENFGDWFPGVISVASKDETAHRQVGKVYIEKVRKPLGGEVDIPLAVVSCKMNEEFQTEGKYPPIWPRMTVRFAKTPDDATRISWRMESRNDGLWFRLTLLPLVRRIMHRRAGIASRRLKAVLEAPRSGF